MQKKVDPNLQVEVKPSIRARKVQEDKLRRQAQKEDYWRRREQEDRWREEMRFLKSKSLSSSLSHFYVREAGILVLRLLLYPNCFILFTASIHISLPPCSKWSSGAAVSLSPI